MKHKKELDKCKAKIAKNNLKIGKLYRNSHLLYKSLCKKLKTKDSNSKIYHYVYDTIKIPL